jgi:DNA/RNA endonuclease G (NUC1)
LASVDDRSRHPKDIYSTFFTSNVLPQYKDANRFGAWRQFERYTNETLAVGGKKLYLTSGGVGYGINPRQVGYPYRTIFNNVLVKDGLVQTDANNRPILANSVPKDSSGNPIPGYSLQAIENEKDIYVPEYLWKVALVLEPGQTLADITRNTQVIAIITPNRSQLQSSTTVSLPNGLQRSIDNWNDWREWQVSVDYLEEITGLNFFSQLQDDIEQTLERQNLFPSAPLLIEENEALVSERIGISNNSPVGPYSFIPHTFQEVSIVEDSSSKVGSIYGSEFKNSIFEIAILEDSFNKYSFLENGSLQVAVAQSSTHQVCKGEVGALQVSTFQVGTSQISTVQANSTQINSLQISTWKFGSGLENLPTEIPLTSSITLQQFLSSHNYSLQNTTVPTWLSFLTGTTPFNLNIAVTDLPTGQLAEAQLTGFDANGKPNADTLLRDYNGNDLGWF